MDTNNLEKPKPKIESRRMNEMETKDFLTKNGVTTLSLAEWNPGEAIIVVFSEEIIENMIERHNSKPTPEIPKNQMPCLIRVDEPAKMYLSGTSGSVVALENAGGRIDYFTIDAETNKITCVKSSANYRGVLDPYFTTVSNIYKSQDGLFPKQSTPLGIYKK
jgi:hypothetical protein